MQGVCLYASNTSRIEIEQWSDGNHSQQIASKHFATARADGFLEAYLHERSSKLSSGVVRFHEQFLKKGVLSIRMELCPKGSLLSEMERKVREQSSFPIDYLLRQTQTLLRTLAALHEARIAHRLIDASNILVSDSGDLKLADFGSAKLIEVSATVQAHTIKNYKRAVAPDVVAALDDYEPAEADPFKLDVWALGKVIYEMTQLKCYDFFNTLPANELPIVLRQRLAAKGFEALFPLLSEMLGTEDRLRITAAEALSLLKSDSVHIPSTPSVLSDADESTGDPAHSIRYCSRCVVSGGELQLCSACYEQIRGFK